MVTLNELLLYILSRFEAALVITLVTDVDDKQGKMIHVRNFCFTSNKPKKTCLCLALCIRIFVLVDFNKKMRTACMVTRKMQDEELNP
jgi:hypothetical protein